MSEGCYPGYYYYTDSCFRQDCKKVKQPQSTQPVITTAPMGLFPTMSSLQEVLDFADSKLPIKNKNELVSILFIYHNTLLKLTEQPSTPVQGT